MAQSPVCVLGAGLMGAQIGCEYALGGHEVTLVARDAAAARARAEAALAMLVELDVIARAAGEDARARIQVAGDVSDAARGCGVVVESLPEDFALKVELLGHAAAAAPAALLASNTSSFRISDIGKAINAPQRTVGTHYWNPPALMPLVEVVAGDGTDPERAREAVELLRMLGKTPIAVRRDVPGFVWNRLQFALVREAAELVRSEVIAPEDLDEIVRDGLARRWRHVGPLRAIGLGGVGTWNAAGRQIFASLSNAPEVADLTDVAIDSADSRAVIRKRDRGLAAELVRRAGLTSSGR
jgi:3-hydroxybutyryl-CoA dehydrogenase